MTAANKQQNKFERLFSRYLLILVAITIMLLQICSVYAHAAQTTLAWDSPVNADGTPVTGISGYKLHLGNASRSYTQTIDVGNTTSYALNSLSEGSTYYFAVTGYNAAGDVSGYSNEVSKALPITYSLTATAGTGGKISPTGSVTPSTATSGSTIITSVTVTKGASQSFSIISNSGYTIANVAVDGISVGAVTSYTFSNVTANHTITASFKAAVPTTTFAISASAAAGGSINPTGSATVSSGTSKTYTIAPAAGYKVAAVKVDGVSVGTVTSYTFSNITANHTIAASFTAVAPTEIGFATNSGGTQFTAANGIVYKAETNFVGGTISTTTSAIAGTVDDKLYQTSRHGKFSYNIPLANGSYSVTLKFAENTYSAAGRRVFNVNMEGKQVISNLDIFAKAGKNTAYDVTIPVSVTDGVLNISFAGTIADGTISGLVIKSN